MRVVLPVYEFGQMSRLDLNLWTVMRAVRVITVFTVFRLLTDFVCLYNYEFWLSLCKIVRSSVILLLPLFCLVRFHQNFNRQPNGYDITINTLHRVGMSNCAHFGVEFTEKPTKNKFSELQTVTSDSKILA